MQLKARIGGVENKSMFTEAKLKHERSSIEDTIKQDIKLDDQRRENEKEEARRAEEAQVAKDISQNKELLQKN